MKLMMAWPIALLVIAPGAQVARAKEDPKAPPQPRAVEYYGGVKFRTAHCEYQAVIHATFVDHKITEGSLTYSLPVRRQAKLEGVLEDNGRSMALRSEDLGMISSSYTYSDVFKDTKGIYLGGTKLTGKAPALGSGCPSEKPKQGGSWGGYLKALAPNK